MGRLRRLFLATLGALTLGTSAPAQSPSDLTGIWQDWMRQHELSVGQIAIRRSGRLVATRAIGTTPDRARPLASVSKTVTAACLDTLAPVIWSRPASDFIAGAPDTALNRYAVHAAGLTPDATQTLRPQTWPGPPADLPIARRAFSRAAGASAVFYNNENYAVLGVVLRQIARDPATRCARALGLPSLGWARDWRGAGAFGGFAATARDVAALGERWSARKPQRIGIAPMPDGVSRAVPGAFVLVGRTPVHAHSGQLCRRDWLLGPRRGDGAWWLNAAGTTIAVTWAGCPPDQAIRRLETAIAEALARG
ncbi:MAG: hypothetical protein ACU0CI_06980 [Shimia sp.]